MTPRRRKVQRMARAGQFLAVVAGVQGQAVALRDARHIGV
jgi:hypothetical protein